MSEPTLKESPIHTLAITGGIGSGKSYIATMLTECYGIPVYNCDKEAKRLNHESPEIRKKLKALVGDEVYSTDGELQKKVLADYLFKNEENAQRINAITHPAVASDFKQWTLQRQAEGHHIVAMECAILFESGFDRLVDTVINVYAPTSICIERATKRDGVDAEAIKRRIAMQMSNEERNQRSQFTILNDGTELKQQLDAIIKKLNA